MSAYSVWAMEYCHVPNYPLSALIYGAHNQGHRRLPYNYILIKGQGRVALVDVGYNHKEYGKILAEMYGVQGWRSPRTVLAECGVAPTDVDTIFLTHSHFDHMGNIEDFPNATFYIQERELSKWVWSMSLERRFRWLNLAVDPADILRCVELARDHRLVSVDGAREDVLPGIDLHAAFDTHTWGSMYVRLRNDLQNNSKDSWVFAGDLVYNYENLLGWQPDDPEYLPAGFAVGSQFNLVMNTEAMMKAVDRDFRRVIPFHEERLKDHYPSRVTSADLRITELVLANGETSRVR